MNNPEKVTIHDPRANAAPPVRYAKAKNARPSANIFKLVPKSFPQLTEYVQSINWDSVNKNVHLTIAETPKFEVMKWFNFMDDQYLIYQKSPFVDLDTNVVLLNFLDHNKITVATMRFKNLKLEEHGCYMSSNQFQLHGAGEDFLKHTVTISYQYAELVVHGDRIEEDDEDFKDGEWQTVELPA